MNAHDRTINTFSAAAYASAEGQTAVDAELQQRLSLYQVFLKLYEHHRGLLDEILTLENSGSKSLASVPLLYIHAAEQGDRARLTTNLLGATQTLNQPQQIWTIGRDARQVGIAVSDKRLSRRHAAVRYRAGLGFDLVDLGSSNGSFVNGEPIRQPCRLKDGDRIRLGSLSIVFFTGSTEQTLGTVLPELLASPAATHQPLPKPTRSAARLDETLEFFKPCHEAL